MGAYSEMDIDLRYGDNPFEEGGAPVCAGESVIPAFTEAATAEPAAMPSALEPAVSQLEQTDGNTAPDVSAQEANTALAETPGDTGSPAAEAAADTVSEDDKKKAHDASEAKRKAEFEARQAAKKAAEQEQLDRLSAMSDDEVLDASMKRVSIDTEKLTRRNMMECVTEYIQTMCIEDSSFARKVMHPRKSMIRCFQHISRKAWDYVQDELKAKGIRPGPGMAGYGCAVPEDLCYEWAVEYFNDPCAKEDYEDEEEFVPKPYIGKSTASTSKAKKKEPKKKAEKKLPPAKPDSTKSSSSEQLTLGDFVMPEEKAG